MISSHSLTAIVPGVDGTLDPDTASITLDEGWSPYVQATLVCPIENTAQLAALDPRTQRRGTLTVRQEFGRVDRIRDLSRRFADDPLAGLSELFAGETIGGISRSLYWDWSTPGAPYTAPSARTLDLGLRSRVLDHVAGTVTLTFASDEALLQDNAHVSIYPLYPPAVNVYEAVQYVLGRIGAGLYESTPEAAAPIDVARNPWQPGTSAWEWLAPIVQAADLRLWCDGLRRWHLTATASIPGDPIALTAAGTITQATDSISRDEEFFKAVLVTYRWADSAGAQQTAYDLAFVPPWLPSTDQRIKQVTYERPYPGPGVAQRLLRFLLGRSRLIRVSAVSDYRAEPGRAVTVALPSTPLQSGVVRAVTWQFPADEMEVTMRGLIDSGPIETEYTPIPDPEEEP